MTAHKTSRLAQGTAVGALVAAAVVAYWAWRADEDSNPNLSAPMSASAKLNAVPVGGSHADESLYRTGIDSRGRSRMGAWVSGGGANLNTGVLSGSSFRPNPR
jgi:hypothetical protein